MWCRSMTIRVGRIPYLNSEPFYYKLVRDDIELYDFVPTAMTRAAEAGELDAGPLPLVDCWRLEDQFKQLGQFCIATVNKSRSVFLFSKRPMEEMEGATVGVTDETSTSKRLLEVLFAHKYQVKPAAYVTLSEENDALLIIGDDALRQRYGVPSYPHQYDLGEEWHSWTGMPFVYALWVVHKDMDPKRATYLENVLYSCIDWGLEHMYVIGQNREDVRMGPREIVEYFQGFRYWAGVSEQKAMKRFREYFDALKTPGAG